MNLTLKLGTRRSLLAWAQSSWVAREIERLNPGAKAELVGIDTRGDKILDVSLQSIEGKEFFVAELDAALRTGDVDFTVHSLKDLSLERPDEFINVATPQRENSRDVILYGPRVLQKLKAGEKIRIGTSSPRRKENLPAFLEKALPSFGAVTPQVELVELRGNVNTRLGRVHEAEGSERHLDGVVLALAGLIRLSRDSAGGPELQRLLSGLRWMVLPLRENPTAPGQGALAIECRKNDQPVIAAVSKLTDAASVDQVAMERQILADWGGGCHQRFGASAVSLEGAGTVLYIRGRKSDGVFVDEARWKMPASPRAAGPVIAWDSTESRAKASPSPIAHCDPTPYKGRSFFIAHTRALSEAFESVAQTGRVWVPGVRTWHQLAARGIWVEGCTEGFGIEYGKQLMSPAVLGLPAFDSKKEWVVLTHEEALEAWSDKATGATAIATYRVPKADTKTCPELEKATHVFWGSGSQFARYKTFVSPEAHHACGPGKTAQFLKSQGMNPVVFPSLEEWKKWIKT
ncbi:hydroxymethylbilane synthase [Bdellovibrionota bacterium FG-2]